MSNAASSLSPEGGHYIQVQLYLVGTASINFEADIIEHKIVTECNIVIYF